MEIGLDNKFNFYCHSMLGFFVMATIKDWATIKDCPYMTILFVGAIPRAKPLRKSGTGNPFGVGAVGLKFFPLGFASMPLS